jgi:hypothetical protein
MPIGSRTVRPTRTARPPACRLRPLMPTTSRRLRAECRRVADRQTTRAGACRRDGVGPTARRRVGTAGARGGQGSRLAGRGCRELGAHAHCRRSGRRNGLPCGAPPDQRRRARPPGPRDTASPELRRRCCLPPMNRVVVSVGAGETAPFSRPERGDVVAIAAGCTRRQGRHQVVGLVEGRRSECCPPGEPGIGRRSG